MTKEEWESVIVLHPSLAESPATGWYDHKVYVVIFLSLLGEDFMTEMIDCWLHEFLEVGLLGEVINHETFNDTVTRIAKYVSTP